DPGPEFLLVAPLDGTREFVEGRPEFTVNIALVRNGAPVIGVVYAPAARLLFSGRPGAASKAVVDDDFAIVSRQPAKVRARPMTPAGVPAVPTPQPKPTNYVPTSGVGKSHGLTPIPRKTRMPASCLKKTKHVAHTRRS